MNTYYLIRHGQDYDNLNSILNGHRNQTLTEIGINQAIESGKKIKELNLKIDEVLTSPLNRTYVTASIVASLNQFPTPIIETDLIERDFGVMTGKKFSDIVPLCSPNILIAGATTYFLTPDGGESFPDLINRAKKLFNKLDTLYSNKKILLVAHGDIGKMLYTTFYDLDWEKVLPTILFGNSEIFMLQKGMDPEKSKIVNIKQFNI